MAPGTKSDTPATKGSTAPGLTTEKEKASYALGMNIGRGLSKQPVDLDALPSRVALRMHCPAPRPALAKRRLPRTSRQLQDQAKKATEAKMQELAAENQKAGAAFLAENKTKEGVVTLPSGLQYKVLTPGTGPKPTATDTVVCQYKGTLLDGTEFDSSYKRGQPATFDGGPRDQGLDGGAAADAGRIEVAAFHSCGSRVRRARRSQRDSPKCNFSL